MAFIIYVLIEMSIFNQYNTQLSLANFGFYNLSFPFLFIATYIGIDSFNNESRELKNQNLKFKDAALYGILITFSFIILTTVFTYIYYNNFNKNISNTLINNIYTYSLLDIQLLNSPFIRNNLYFEFNTYYLIFQLIIYSIFGGFIASIINSLIIIKFK